MNNDEDKERLTICICTRVCDCEAPDGLTSELEKICAPLSRYGLGKVVALCSEECPEHNSIPNPHPECEAKIHWFEDGFSGVYANSGQLDLNLA